jgi:hypothetical protein
VADLVNDESAAAAPVQPEGAPFFRQKPSSDVVVNPRRFGLAYLVLAIAIGAAVGLAIVLIGRGTSHHAAVRSQAFSPTKSGELGAKQIARHVAHKYRLASGQELVPVIGERPNYQNLQLFNYVIRPHDAQYPNDINVFPVDNGIMYSMCGFGQACSPLSSSSGSQPTLELLKREALELAFDTFKTDSAVDTVTTLLPPANQQGFAIILRRDDLSSVLNKSLGSLLPGGGPFKPGSMSADEQSTVDLLIAPGLYSYDAQIGPDGNPILRLDPLG